MSFYEKGPVRTHYEEAGSGFPLLLISGGGLNSAIAGLRTGPFNAIDEYQIDDDRSLPYQLSRGCTDKCTFCSEWVSRGQFQLLRLSCSSSIRPSAPRKSVLQGGRRLWIRSDAKY